MLSPPRRARTRRRCRGRVRCHARTAANVHERCRALRERSAIQPFAGRREDIDVSRLLHAASGRL